MRSWDLKLAQTEDDGHACGGCRFQTNSRKGRENSNLRIMDWDRKIPGKIGLVLLHLLANLVWVFSQTPSPSCPLNFTVLDLYPSVADTIKETTNSLDTRCVGARAGLALVLSVYLHDTGFFLPPHEATSPCYMAYLNQLVKQGVSTSFNLSADCPLKQFQLDRDVDYCQGLRNVSDWERVLETDSVKASCAEDLSDAVNCGRCNTAQVSMYSAVQRLGLTNRTEGCQNFTLTYIAGWVNENGPLDPGTALCVLYVQSSSTDGGGLSSRVYIGVGVGAVVLLGLLGVGAAYWRHSRIQQKKKEARSRRTADLITSTRSNESVTWYILDEMKKATKNFSRENLLGTGGYGNVYKGVLPNGETVAIKRFKNCSPAGDRDFVHEVEVISSVRHKHLVAIRGCCVDQGDSIDGHQRFIVLDYMSNGTLQDHLFPKKAGAAVLPWKLRFKIAEGTARGLAYLHYGALPSIIHRDIKPSNILLDNDFVPRLGDFGLAKYSPDGVSHLTTKVAGTYGYVAPEYAFYGQLTDKSDVYSFGMVLLELVTGKRALIPGSETQPPRLLSDEVWPCVKRGDWQAVVDPSLDEVASDETMQRFILTALLCAHPQVQCRPSLEDALKMLESTDVVMPEIPDRPPPLTSNLDEIEEHYSSGSFSRSIASTAWNMSSRRTDDLPTPKHQHADEGP